MSVKRRDYGQSVAPFWHFHGRMRKTMEHFTSDSQLQTEISTNYCATLTT